MFTAILAEFYSFFFLLLLPFGGRGRLVPPSTPSVRFSRVLSTEGFSPREEKQKHQHYVCFLFEIHYSWTFSKTFSRGLSWIGICILCDFLLDRGRFFRHPENAFPTAWRRRLVPVFANSLVPSSPRGLARPRVSVFCFVHFLFSALTFVSLTLWGQFALTGGVSSISGQKQGLIGKFVFGSGMTVPPPPSPPLSPPPPQTDGSQKVRPAAENRTLIEYISNTQTSE